MSFAGILVAGPELTFMSTGMPVATFTVAATDRNYHTTTAQLVADTEVTFLPCTISHQTAENVATSLTKSMRVMVTGVLRQRAWQSLQGDARYAYEIAVSEIGLSLAGQL
ncbi:MAG: single-stranded DNA-binding protein [Pseudonocardiaceae bacterium]